MSRMADQLGDRNVGLCASRTTDGLRRTCGITSLCRTCDIGIYRSTVERTTKNTNILNRRAGDLQKRNPREMSNTHIDK